MTTNNPLLDLSDLPRFADILPEHVAPAIDALLAENRNVVAQLENLQGQINWDNFVRPLSLSGEKLSRAWGMVQHLHSVLDSPALRDAYNEQLPKLSEFWSALGQNLALFEKYKALAASSQFAQLSPARRTIIEHQIRGFRLGGAELGEAEKARFAQIQEQLSQLSAKFSQNVLDATNDFVVLVEDQAELAGLPDDVLAAARAAAEAAGQSGWQFSLHQPSLVPVLQYAQHRPLREKLYQANVTRASDQASAFSKNQEWDNSENIVQILRLRAEEAQLLGYQHYAELSLVPKMADTPEQVISFLQDLAQKARPFAERDLQQMRDFARSELDLADLQAWDTGYVAEKLREKQYAFSAQEVKRYFQQDKVLAGLFKLLQNLFDVQILPQSAANWHPDVQFFRIERAGKLIGQFYLDLYARSGKRGGAWMDSARSRRKLADSTQTPIAYMVCNFTAPVVVDGVRQPVLLNHTEMITLFHEFGHGLHHLLTQVDELEVAGINGVEWDAVELPSQMMENFCWQFEVLQDMSAHVDTGEALPRTLFDKMLAAKNFHAGLMTLRQIEFALIDMRLHYQFVASDANAVQAMVDQVRQQVAVIIPPAYNRFQHAFSHIFAGGYSAGYYSYKWAEVLSADAFAAFEEESVATGSVLKVQAGQRFMREVLEMGAVRGAMESFKAFRGRAPQIDALLRHNGMAAPDQAAPLHH